MTKSPKGTTRQTKTSTRAADPSNLKVETLSRAGAKRTTNSQTAAKGGSEVLSPSAMERPQTKITILRTRLSQTGGASMSQLMDLTGWQAHTVRAALSGLRKAGLTINRQRDGDQTIYAITGSTELGSIREEDDLHPNPVGTLPSRDDTSPSQTKDLKSASNADRQIGEA